jgi:putative nucleotidyltransferase with HDIG domain
MNYKEELFEEINKIKNPEIYSFILEVLENTDPRFWISPCSSSGRFHPHEDNGESGLIRHLIKASYISEQFGGRAMFSDYEMDIARTATLLHDICKDGNPWGDSTDYRHGIIGAEFLEDFYLEDKTAKQLILDGVRYHMSPWNTSLEPDKYFLLNGKGGTKKEGVEITLEDIKKELAEVKRGLMPHSIIETCVQQADYWASREGMSFMPGIPVNLDYRHDAG